MTQQEMKRECNRRYNRSKKGVVSRLYGQQKTSSQRRGHNPPSYTKEELKEWLYKQPLFHRLYSNWEKSDYASNLKPSIDRVDSDKGYAFTNIQLVTWEQNNRKGYLENMGSRHHNAKSKEYYATKAIARDHFKRVCKTQSWKYADFIEVPSGRRSGVNKAYYYCI